MKNNGGDDWNDRPYEHNSGEPYDSWYDDKSVKHEIKIKKIYFEIPYYYDLPCTKYINSPYSVEDINNKEVPWITVYWGIKRIKIFAETSYTEFIKKIESLNGAVYLPQK